MANSRSKKPKSFKSAKARAAEAEFLRRSKASKKGHRERKKREELAAAAALFAKRSRAAKKGHRTRKKLQAAALPKKRAAKPISSKKRQRKTLTAAAVIAELGKVKRPRRKPSNASIERNRKDREVLELRLQLRERDLQLLQRTEEMKEIQRIRENLEEWDRIDKLTRETFIFTRGPEWYHSDGTIAVAKSRLRNHPDVMKIRALMEEAQEQSPADLLDMATFLAERYDAPVGEVYTVFMSP